MYRYKEGTEPVMFNIGNAEVLILLALVVGLAVFLVVLAVRGGSDDAVDAWARSFGVRVAEDDRPMVAAALARTRRYRLVFAIAAVVGQGAVRTWLDDPLPWANTIVFGIVGYLLGAVVAEVAMPVGWDRNAGAVLAPRRVSDYISRIGVSALVTLPIAAAAAVAWTIDLAPPPRLRDASPRTFALLVAASVAISVIVGLGLRILVRRPQPAESRERALLDDALRSTSMHAMTGAAVALQLLLLAFALGQLQGGLSALGGSTRVQLAATLGAMFSLAFALGAWVVLGHPSAWRTRRHLGAPAA
jgi:hypothetical protein